METIELTKVISNQVLAERGYALVWMSAGNSYFKEDAIRKILEFTKSNFNKTIVMAPDAPAEHTFRALGYTGNDIKRKARLNANLLQNRARRVVSSFGENESSKFKVVEWIDEIEKNKDYLESLKLVKNLYQTKELFRKDANKTTKEVLLTKIGNLKVNMNLVVGEAVNYLLEELAFVLASPRIYKVEKINYVYHKPWSIYEKLIRGQYDGLVRDRLGFVLFR